MKLQQLCKTVFECTDWHMFRDAAVQENHINLEEYTSSVTSYIRKCVDDVVITINKDNKITPQPESLDELSSLLRLQRTSHCQYPQRMRVKTCWA